MERKSDYFSERKRQTICEFIRYMLSRFADGEGHFRPFSLLTPEYRVIWCQPGTVVFHHGGKTKSFDAEASQLVFVRHGDEKAFLTEIPLTKSLPDTLFTFLVDECELDTLECQYACLSGDLLEEETGDMRSGGMAVVKG